MIKKARGKLPEKNPVHVLEKNPSKSLKIFTHSIKIPKNQKKIPKNPIKNPKTTVKSIPYALLEE